MGVLDKAKNWKENYKKKSRNRTIRKIDDELPESAGPRYRLLDEIKKSPLYRKSQSADAIAYEYLTEHIKVMGAGNIQPGQLIIFEYFEPKTKEELEYYDSRPLTIFFNVVTTSQGKRVLGFNIHYYPPKMRYNIMNTIFSIYKPIYTKYFKEGKESAIDAFDYRYLINALESAGLEFGVRMYDPSLINRVRMIPPQMWHVAVFTEGWFKKQTRAAIMNYWKQWVKKHNHNVVQTKKKKT